MTRTSSTLVRLILLLVLGLAAVHSSLFPPALGSQKKGEPPKVHNDFYFGTFPTSREGQEEMSNERARLLAVAYHEGWSVDKVVKELKLPKTDVDELNKLNDRLEDKLIAGRVNDYDFRPFFPVIRDKDFALVDDGIRRHTQEFTTLLESKWSEIESFSDGLKGSSAFPKPRRLYEFVISGILLGGMIEAFFENKTMLVPTGRRGYYAWLVEHNSERAGTIKREIRESTGFRFVSVGRELPVKPVTILEDLEGKGPIFRDDEEARRYRQFVSLLSRDTLFPYFKARREEIFRMAGSIQASKYTAFKDFVAWYYQQVVSGVERNLVGAKKIEAPEKFYTYALKAPVQ